MDNIFGMMVPSILVEPYSDMYDSENFQHSIVNKFIVLIKENYSMRFYPFKWKPLIIFKRRLKKHKKKTHGLGTLWSSSFGDKACLGGRECFLPKHNNFIIVKYIFLS